MANQIIRLQTTEEKIAYLNTRKDLKEHFSKNFEDKYTWLLNFLSDDEFKTLMEKDWSSLCYQSINVDETPTQNAQYIRTVNLARTLAKTGIIISDVNFEQLKASTSNRWHCYRCFKKMFAEILSIDKKNFYKKYKAYKKKIKETE